MFAGAVTAPPLTAQPPHAKGQEDSLSVSSTTCDRLRWAGS
ncbi:hypothetical protein HMPREF9616_01810 [Cutibacterium acnes HL007PA1]|nr:hypothetical protein HMPREF9616_01810 [Cutibacterium acnes HL007PA1]